MSGSAGPPPKSASSKASRWLVGLALGCGGLLVVAGIALAIAAFWLFGSGPQVASEKILGPQSQGYVALPDPAGDAGIAELLTVFIGEVQAAEGSRSDLPEFLRGFEQMQQNQGAANLQMWLPREVTVAFEQPAGAEAAEILAAINLRSFPRLIKTIVESQAEVSDAVYRDHRVQDLGEIVMAFHGTTLLAAASRETLEIGIDRLEDGSSDRAPPALATDESLTHGDLFGRLPAGSGLLEAALGKLLEMFPARDAAESLEQVSDVVDGQFSLDLVDADALTAELWLTCRGAGAAQRWARRLSGSERLDHGLTVTSEARAEGARVETRLELRGLREALRAMVHDEEF
ncbi:MAG: hypothetical protein AAF604_08780 [Acidobacteriota bacterium]